MDAIKAILARIYGSTKGEEAFKRILPVIERFPAKASAKKAFFSQKDAYLITYGDTLQSPGQKPLAAFRRFAATCLKDVFSAIHFLPFFPYSSDDGFSVMDFYTIDPELGDWTDVAKIAGDFELMFDYVVNHFSSRGQWFANYLADRQGFRNFAIAVDPSLDVSMVTRPRSLPLLTEYRKHDGRSVHLWTTFSADQIDFNFKSLDVLEKMIDVLLFYVRQGAASVRMDAVAYLWKEIGTSCIHLPQTHDMVKLFRAVLNVVAPDVIIITETNVPHSENIGYFGNGRDEAQMVYNFTLPPLLLHAFVKQDATLLSQWAAGLGLESDTATFFNFTASHDGIGVRPLEGILPPEELDDVIDRVRSNGGQVSTKRNPDGGDSPYELNITYLDAIIGDPASDNVQKFLASQAVQYILPGVPATYIHSLLGSRNWTVGVQQTGRARSINREKLQADSVISALNDPASFRSRVFHAYRHMITVRRRQPAFHPNAAFEILNLHPSIFAIRRQAENQRIFALTNLSAQTVRLRTADIGLKTPAGELLSGRPFDGASIELRPYEFLWLTPELET